MGLWTQGAIKLGMYSYTNMQTSKAGVDEGQCIGLAAYAGTGNSMGSERGGKKL